MSDDDAKEWVTIKIPATVRDKARDDPRTYGEVMQAGLKNEATLRFESDNHPKNVIEELKNELSMLNDPAVGLDDEGVERVLGRLDDLEAQLPRKIAEELQR